MPGRSRRLGQELLLRQPLPAAGRSSRAIFALYDFCRHADNLVDERGDRPVRGRAPRSGRARRRWSGRCTRGAAPADERWLALHDTLQRYPVPLAPLLELLDGVAMDIEPVAIADFPALQQLLPLCGRRRGADARPRARRAARRRLQEPGVRLGIAMQLTNVLRDVGEDLDSGPGVPPGRRAGELRGCPGATSRPGALTPRLRVSSRSRSARARRVLRGGGAGRRAVPRRRSG